MKAYKDYMDHISVSNELHGKIMQRLAPPGYRRRPARRVAAAAACAVAMAAALWVLVPKATLPNPSEQSPGPQDQIVLNGGTLFFNKTDGADMADSASKRYVEGYFQENVAGDTVASLFGGEHPVAGDFVLDRAIAGYGGDGSLVDLSIKYVKDSQEIVISAGREPLLLLSTGPVVSTIHGTPVTAFWYEPGNAQDVPLFAAYFERHGKIICVETNFSQELLADTLAAILAGEVEFSELVPAAIPEWREDTLILHQARADADFGAYIPTTIPSDFSFESAKRIVNQTQNKLNVYYRAGLRYIELSISRKTPEVEKRLADITRPETYDLSLYPIPWAESVPEELREIVREPVFRLDDITLEILKARAYQVNDTGDDNTGHRLQFGVLVDNVVIDLNIKGSTPEDVLGMLNNLGTQ